VKTGVILRYTINIDWPKVDCFWYKLDIVLKDPEKKQKIVDYLENNPHLEARMESLGYVDIELTLNLNNATQIYQIMEDLSSKFPDTIKNYKYMSAIKTHKFEGTDFWNR
jgi:DNA-binding Lrp family transcriptional regulator